MARKRRGKQGSEGSKPPEVAQPAKEAVPPTEGKPFQFEHDIGDYFARVIVPHELYNSEKRYRCGLPRDEKERGPYIIELNVQHVGSLPGAANDFEQLFDRVMNEGTGAPAPGGAGDRAAAASPSGGTAPKRRKPVRLSKSYYRCRLSVDEWRRLVAEDGKNPLNHRCIYKLWPDFPIKAQMDRSVTTIKADAAHRAFDASGDGIIWAVIDTGIDADHPHFGKRGAPDHLLRNSEVNDLHRSFAYIIEEEDGVRFESDPLPSPDVPSADPDPKVRSQERQERIEAHRAKALSDDIGHGTHVAGIIAGSAPAGLKSCVLERVLKSDEQGHPIPQNFKTREVASRDLLTGVAPLCKLISLRVLNDENQGRVSSVISALEYVRESLNNNPKLMRVHGVNLSVGYDFDAEMFACGQSPLCVEVDRLVQSGVVVVAAAGNTGYGTVAAQVGGAKVGLSNTINDPGNADLAITVGSTHREAPHTYGVSFFSSKGPTGDGRLKPDLVAPGERITSCAAGNKLKQAMRSIAAPDLASAAAPPSAPAGDRPAPAPGDDAGTPFYIDDSGTSMAAPHVSGAIAAFLSIRREFIGKPIEVKRIFLESATPLGRERYFEGHGLVDLMRAIQSV
jgi:subtilisin family serine protease